MECKRSSCTPECNSYHGNCPYDDEIPKYVQKLIDKSRGKAYEIAKLLDDIYFENERLGEVTIQQVMDIIAGGKE